MESYNHSHSDGDGAGGGGGQRPHTAVEIPETAHQISHDSWFQVGFVLTTGINSAYVLGYSGTIMVPLGWIAGVLGLIAATAISLYANTLIAKLHEFGGRRHIRYRDLAGFIYGPRAYQLTWALQYVNLFMINTGFIILAGQALKAVYVLFRDDGAMKLPYCIAIAGIVCAIFAVGIPHLSALRVWLGFSTFFSLVYIVIAIALAARDGSEAPARDYGISGTKTGKIFTTIGAAANLVFAFNTGMLPEIQATVRQPVVKNMMKALYFQFTVGVLPMYAVAFVAGRSGFGSTRTMIVTNTPAKDLAYTNFAYCSPSDLRNFLVSGSKLAFSLVADAFVLSLSPHESIPNGHIALNAIQRRHAKVSSGDTISISRFVPPDDFNLALLTLELEFVKKGTKDEQVDAVLLAQQIRKRFINQVMTTGQRVTFEYHGNGYIFTVNQAAIEGQEKSSSIERGMISSETYIVFEASNSSGIKIVNQREAASSNIFRHKEFNLQSLGIGGLSAEFADIFRRAFASRVFPPHVTNKLGIKHVKGMLLFGPPGTGKTLMARQIGKMLNGKEPKIVNGPEVLSKFVGETEKNVRDLFADAEQDQRTRGDQSDLHVIIFDEIDAICKSRGSTRDGTGVHDSIVNQLLTKIDGVESLNNVLLIGMTNRKDLLDEALLRPGRLEVQVEISLPDENGRLQILQIHTNKMKENSFLAPDVDLLELAARTKNYSGAELEGVVKSAVSFALNRQLSMDDLTKPVDEESIKVTMEDFLNALYEVRPAFGASTDDLDRCRLNGVVDCGARHEHIYKRTMLLAEQVRVSKGSPLVTCLLEGPSGSGKSAMASSVGIDSDFPYVKIISAESMIGLSEASKCAQIVKVFEDAYKSPLSIIILDDIERLLEYVAIGPRFSNLISQTLLVLLKRLPPKGKNVLVIGTTSEVTFLDSIGICDAFSVTYHVPTLKSEDARKVLQQLNVFSENDVDAAAEALNDMPIKKLYMVVEMAAQGEQGGGAEAIYSGKEKIKISHFYDCLQDIVRY